MIASSRSTYGYKRNILKLLKKDPSVNLKVIVTGMHLSKKHGYSIKDIYRDKIPIFKKVYTNIKKDTTEEHVKSLSTEMFQLSKIFSKLKPDIILVTGDRAEMFAAAMTAVYMNVPVAHIQAGDLSGHIDGSVRHAITKISHLHFASCPDSANRVKKLGEQKFRIFNTGAPQIDDFYMNKKINQKQFEKKYNFKFRKNNFLIINHPVIYEINEASNQFSEIIKATDYYNNFLKIILYPNIDSGNSKIIKKIKSLENKKNYKIFKNLNRDEFIFLLSNSKILLGNSSCGILEASSFKLPVINLGDRQRGRLQSENIINTDYSSKKINKVINFILNSKKFINKVKKCKNPYGNGKSSKKIIKILKSIKINKKLLDKKNTF